jgi:transcriptional regulator with XRE-family HTH domain
MDVSLLIRQRLRDRGLDQKDLAAAAQVTESYISQLLARKKAPPAPERTDIYDKIEDLLGLPAGELAKLAAIERQQELKKRVAEPARPLFQHHRELILRKCAPDSRREMQRILEREPFGEVERLVIQKILQVAQGLAREELRSEGWLHSMAQVNGRSYEEMRVAALDFLDTDVFHISVEGCASFLDPMIDSWDIDLRTFTLTVILDRRMAPDTVKRFAFVETSDDVPSSVEPGLIQFLEDPSLSGDATEEELGFLKSLSFKEKRPSALYYYRELQSLRDPLHFPPTSPPAPPSD